MSFKPTFQTEGTFTPDHLRAGDFPVRTAVVTIAAGAAHVRGELLGKITADGNYDLSASAAADGSEAPVAILAEDADATDGAVEAVVYITGDFNSNAMTFGTGHTADSVRDALAAQSIFIEPAVAY
jgi:hypothetical protein